MKSGENIPLRYLGLNSQCCFSGLQDVSVLLYDAVKSWDVRQIIAY